MLHVIDAGNSFPFDRVNVADDRAGNTPTTVDVLTGGEVGTSIVDGDLIANDRSIIRMSGGQVGRDLDARGSAQIEVSGGNIQRWLTIQNSATITMSGGTVNGLNLYGLASGMVTGGTVLNGVDVRNGTQLSISGGSFGTLFDNLEARGSAQVSITGGEWDPRTQFLALEESSITVFGSGFNLPVGDIAASSGVLTGILSDGTPLNVNYSRASAATITLIQSVPASSIRASKEDLLALDNDGDGRPDPGDTVRYSIVISNVGMADAEASALLDMPDLNSSLLVGSVTTTQGTVLMGNGPSDASVEVDIGTLAQGGGNAEVTFDVLVNDPFPPGILIIANQGEVSGSNFDPVQTDDPGTPAFPDPTLTEVANTELDICERELQECLETPTFADADDDGEHDFTDQCPDTPINREVDGNGCSAEQFCGQFDVSTGYGRASCNNADWRNNQPVGRAGDCRATRIECLPQQRLPQRRRPRKSRLN